MIWMSLSLRSFFATVPVHRPHTLNSLAFADRHFCGIKLTDSAHTATYTVKESKDVRSASSKAKQQPSLMERRQNLTAAPAAGLQRLCLASPARTVYQETKA